MSAIEQSAHEVDVKLEGLFNAALELPTEARATLIERLRDTLSPRLAKEIEESWEAEIERRIDEVEQGTAKLVPGEEVFRSLHERYGK